MGILWRPPAELVGFFKRLKRLGYTRCDTMVAVLIAASDCDLFHMLQLSKQFVHHSLPPFRKCSDLREIVVTPGKIPDL